jgi:hypothetical protein
MQLRTATSADAVAVAALHADSWRRHYRGVYRDEYLVAVRYAWPDPVVLVS